MGKITTNLSKEFDIIMSDKTTGSNELVCVECLDGNMQMNEVRDEWRKKRNYYEDLKKGPGKRQCMGVDNISCKKMIHSEIANCGVAYICRNGMCYKEEDIECDNWLCFDCYLQHSGGSRKRNKRN